MYAIGGVEASYSGEIFTVGGWATRASLPHSFSPAPYRQRRNSSASLWKILSTEPNTPGAITRESASGSARIHMSANRPFFSFLQSEPNFAVAALPGLIRSNRNVLKLLRAVEISRRVLKNGGGNFFEGWSLE